MIIKCPKCKNTSFILRSHIVVEDRLFFDEDGAPIIEVEELDGYDISPFDCDEIECEKCGEIIDKSLLRKIDLSKVRW
jgi:predicted nucleic-acid-binding Zn-ribbon protein